MRIKLTRVLFAAAVGSMGVFALPAAASAAPSPLAAMKSYGPVTCGNLALSSNEVRQGEQITASDGPFFDPNESVVATITNSGTIGTGQAASNGSWSLTATIPSNEPLGNQTITATGQTSNCVVTAEVQVVSAVAPVPTAPPSSLAFTGADIAGAAGVGAVAIGLGGGLMLISRKRRRSEFADHA